MRSMRGSTSAVNGFPLIFRVIFRFIFESAFGSGLRYMMVTKSSGKSKGWAGRASRAGAGGEGLGACAGCARLGGIGQICASRAPFGPGAKLDEQSRYHWNQRSWRAAALGAGRAGMDEDEPSGGGRRGLVEVPGCDERKAARPTARASRGDENGCDSTIAATSALFGPGLLGCAGKHFSADQSQFPVGHLVSWCPRHFGMSDRISRGFSEDAFRTVLR